MYINYKKVNRPQSPVSLIPSSSTRQAVIDKKGVRSIEGTPAISTYTDAISAISTTCDSEDEEEGHDSVKTNNSETSTKEKLQGWTPIVKKRKKTASTKGSTLGSGKASTSAKASTPGSTNTSQQTITPLAENTNPRKQPQPIPSESLGEPVVLYYNSGFSFPLSINSHGALTVKVILGLDQKIFSFTLSSTRRTITISTRDAKKYDISVDQDDLVCIFPAKKCQLYCTPVSLPTVRINSLTGQVGQDSAFKSETLKRNKNRPLSSLVDTCASEMEGLIVGTTMNRCDVYVGEGEFTSRLGLAGSIQRRSIFSMLKQQTDLFSICLRGRYRLGFGKRAQPPDTIKAIHLMDGFKYSKEYFILPIYSLRLGNETIISNSSGKKRVKRLNSSSKPIPGILHLEIQEICLPESIFLDCLNKIRKCTGLPIDKQTGRGGVLFDGINKATGNGKFPTLELYFRSSDHPTITLSPFQYLQPIKGTEKAKLLLLPLKKSEETEDCVILGNCILRERKTSFSLAQKSIWFW